MKKKTVVKKEHCCHPAYREWCVNENDWHSNYCKKYGHQKPVMVCVVCKVVKEE